MLLCTLGATLLGNILTVKGVMKTDEGTIKIGKETTRAAQHFLCRLIP